MTKEPKQHKVKAVAEISEKIEKSKIMILTNHQGLTVEQITILRNRLFDVNAQYKVVKNTFLARAVSGDAVAGELTPHLNEATSVIFGYEDVVAPAKILVSFIKENEKPGIKCAVMDGIVLDVASIKKLAALPAKEVLLGMTLRAMKSPITGLVTVLQGPIKKLVYALSEIQKKRGV